MKGNEEFGKNTDTHIRTRAAVCPFDTTSLHWSHTHTHTYIHTYIHIYIYIYIVFFFPRSLPHIYTHTHTYIYIYIYIYCFFCPQLPPTDEPVAALTPPPCRGAVVGYRFSAFWLRSSVVSGLISLISDTSSTRGLYIKWIFGTGSRKRGLLRPLHASTRYCSAAGNGALLSLSKNRILHGFPHSLLLCHR